MKPIHDAEPGGRPISDFHIFRVHSPSADDLARARALKRVECPRRYCWWWCSLAFEWGLAVSAGCRVLGAAKPPGWPDPDVPCCRLDPSSTVDHYEPREPYLLEDGFEVSHWLHPADDGQRENGC